MRLYRTKLKVIFLGVILTGVVLLIYQMIYLDFPRDELLDYSGYSKIVESGKQTLLRGIHRTDTWRYRPNERGNFMCFHTREELDFSRVNDDFCDCVFDGSDEPGTNACQNGRFYCDTQNSGFPGNWDINPRMSVSEYEIRFVFNLQSVWFQNLFCQAASMMEYVTAVMGQMSGLKSISPSDWRVGIST